MADIPLVVEGTLETEEKQDIIEVELEENQSYTVAVLGDSNDGGDLLDPILFVDSPSGEDSFFIDDIFMGLGADPVVTFVARESGTYELTVGGLDIEDGPGSYTLMVDEFGSELFDDLLGGIA